MRQPTTDELLAALGRIRALPRCTGWPDDLAAVLGDPVRARLLRIEAVRLRRPTARVSYLRASMRRPRPPSTLPALDLKRAAAGERDD